MHYAWLLLPFAVCFLFLLSCQLTFDDCNYWETPAGQQELRDELRDHELEVTEQIEHPERWSRFFYGMTPVDYWKRYEPWYYEREFAPRLAERQNHAHD